MSTQTRPVPQIAPASTDPTNGPGAAAILAAGIGCFMVAVFATLADKTAFFHNFFIFWKPTGPLSGVTSSAIAVWLVVWAVLRIRWRSRKLALLPINAAAIVLLILSLLLTFPPIEDLF